MVGFDSDTFIFDKDGKDKNLISRLTGSSPECGAISQQEIVNQVVDPGSRQSVNYGARFADYLHIRVYGVAIVGVLVAETQPCPYDAKPKLHAKGNANTHPVPRMASRLRESQSRFDVASGHKARSLAFTGQ
ncbi:uncharacterized protein LY79DRAFT_580851 [Colletotrichum navitas]|uniref:Uncharacterized protein n=1 Tax=Colletotrichum navitas TaxID=681940 RepID=A0AAD8PX70_9PEZI|nr:uncharacterized protein LY79DRAFT_580851 [Colletotrichum navitas]KAK1585825.1 hypothetical protein LY79DRAFT_580851 [Colletotrichum navitas]